MDTKICLITGATAGIGKESARKLTQMGFRVVLVGRNSERLQAAQDEIKTSDHNGQVDTLKADLSSMAEVRQLAQEFLGRYDRLDVLLNNAGGFFLRRERSLDGYEMTFALNHLSYFLLTNLLLDCLLQTARQQGEARVINVSSDASQGGKINFADLNYTKGYFGWSAYAQSKLANILFTFELHRRLVDNGVTANALHPGFVATNFAHNNGGLVRMAIRLTQRLGRSVEQGAETPVYLASSPEIKGKSGGYYIDCQPAKAPALAYDRVLAERLWQVSAEMVGFN